MAGYEPITRRVYWDDIDTMKKPNPLFSNSVIIYELFLYKKKDGKSIPKYKIVGYNKEGVVELSNKFKDSEDVFSIKEPSTHPTCWNPMYETPTAIDIETGEII